MMSIRPMMNHNADESIEAARHIILALGLPKAQHNERSALSLLALLNLPPGTPWSQAENPLMGITPIILHPPLPDWCTSRRSPIAPS